MKKRPIVISVLLLVVIIILIFRFMNRPQKYDYKFFAMGGIPCMLVQYDVTKDEAAKNAKNIEAKVGELEKVFSIYQKGSEADKLNRLPADKWEIISPEMYKILEESLTWYGKTSGAFDITVEPLVRLWKKRSEEKKVPTKSEIREKLKNVGSKYITLSPEKGVKFSKEGMEVDFGGIAKGFILDKAEKFLAGRGVNKYVLSCGGDVVMQGKKRFRVGIQEPGGGEEDLMMVMGSPPGAVVTSGHYQRYYEIEGKKYSHILDPATGMPVDNDLHSITIWSKNAADADALATALAVLGLNKSIDFLKRSNEYRAVLLAKQDKGYEIHYSKLLADELEFIGKWADVPHKEF